MVGKATWCTCNRADSGAPTWGHSFKFQAAQIRANLLAQGSGLGIEGVETRVAGLLSVSDATYGEKNMPWHGSYGKCLTPAN